MYVEYLDKLLADIERHRKLTLGQDGTTQLENSESKADSLESECENVSSLNDENKRRSTVDHIEAVANEQIDLRRASMIQDSEPAPGMVHDKPGILDEDSPFVTVINVTAAANANTAKAQEDKFNNSYEVQVGIILHWFQDNISSKVFFAVSFDFRPIPWNDILTKSHNFSSK